MVTIDETSSPVACQQLCQIRSGCVNWMYRAIDHPTKSWNRRGDCVLKTQADVDGALSVTFNPDQTTLTDTTFCERDRPLYCQSTDCLTCSGSLRCVWQSQYHLSGPKYCALPDQCSYQLSPTDLPISDATPMSGTTSPPAGLLRGVAGSDCSVLNNWVSLSDCLKCRDGYRFYPCNTTDICSSGCFPDSGCRALVIATSQEDCETCHDGIDKWPCNMTGYCSSECYGSTTAVPVSTVITISTPMSSPSVSNTTGHITDYSTIESTSVPTTAGPIPDDSTMENTASGSDGPPPNTECILRNVNFDGNDIKPAVRAADLTECVGICHSLQACKFITLRKDRNQRYCHLKSSDAGEEVKAGYLSMRMSCLSESTSSPTAGPITDDSTIESTSAPTTAGPITDSTIESTS
ncbi:MAG: hypothetical protein KVP17_000502, partial [Porospora cf. gigantea B]